MEPARPEFSKVWKTGSGPDFDKSDFSALEDDIVQLSSLRRLPDMGERVRAIESVGGRDTMEREGEGQVQCFAPGVIV